MNHLAHLRGLLQSIYNCPSVSVPFETIVVDNCSSDGTPDFLRACYPEVRLMPKQNSDGFAANNNIGIRKSRGDFVLLLNPDVVIQSRSVETLLDHMLTHPSVGIGGPQLLNTDLSPQFSCRRFVNVYTVLLRALNWGKDESSREELRRYLMMDVDLSEAQAVDWVIGAAMIVRRKAFDQVGLFDERFFLYIEDQDWCFRMWREGWQVNYIPQAKMIHSHQRSSVRSRISLKTFHHVKSMAYFLGKHHILGSASARIRRQRERLGLK
jgi:GT2 family glycosyltransferase